MGERLEIWKSHLVILVETPKASEKELQRLNQRHGEVRKRGAFCISCRMGNPSIGSALPKNILLHCPDNKYSGRIASRDSLRERKGVFE